MAVARTQTLVQLSDELLALLDERASRERRSRSELVREAIESYLGASREAEIDRQIIEGYTSKPPRDVWSDAPAKDLIRAEPW
jgi:metal-responsive CopG/Arc/MetJ family transcriptional regulator